VDIDGHFELKIFEIAYLTSIQIIPQAQHQLNLIKNSASISHLLVGNTFKSQAT
jgi:hypothetical protein